ncbi:hypothetical protein VPH35_070312 [Triticum aestivum]
MFAHQTRMKRNCAFFELKKEKKTRLLLGWVGVGRYLECWAVQPPSRAQHVPPPRPQNSPIRPAPGLRSSSAPPNPPPIPPIRSAPRRNRPPRAPPIPAAGGCPRGEASRRPVNRPPRRRRLYQGEDPYELVGCEFI